MKPTEKAALWAAAGGIVMGGGLAWLLPEAVWWIPVGFGCLVAGGIHHQTIKDMAAERIANGDFPPGDKS
ncbi:hypothetical protein [Stutzerimonas nitrititolerans]|uniref:hypothetical protein n=1 Tax=Stutzerimonas nitrititolerans TaxID=2482751 RepID=UPI0028AF30BA|nr:hypothetical protein [Stutzerimonas nitrititolerans]